MAGVPAGYRVTAVRGFPCRVCHRTFYLPARGLDGDGRSRRLELYSRRCAEHRRPYEQPPSSLGVRDSQRSAVYAWEHTIPIGSLESIDLPGFLAEFRGRPITVRRLREVGPRRRFVPMWGAQPRLTPTQCRELADSVWAALYPSDPFGPPDVRVKRGRKHSAADAEEIVLAPSMSNEMTLLHEIAHVYLCRVVPRGTIEDHGPEFTALYLHLLGEHAGVDPRVARALGEARRPRRVRFASDAELDRLLRLGTRRRARAASGF